MCSTTAAFTGRLPLQRVRFKIKSRLATTQSEYQLDIILYYIISTYYYYVI
jgi:hypothetical protein